MDLKLIVTKLSYNSKNFASNLKMLIAKNGTENVNQRVNQTIDFENYLLSYEEWKMQKKVQTNYAFLFLFWRGKEQ